MIEFIYKIKTINYANNVILIWRDLMYLEQMNIQIIKIDDFFISKRR